MNALPPPTNDFARRAPGEVGTANSTGRKVTTKIDRIIGLLRSRPEGLNRFEAEQFGEHCLNSTVAIIRATYGAKLIQRWETVPSRFSDRGVRVLRFWLVAS
ncbi:MAG: hypothetical protein Q8S20_15680 [Sulfuritalea sp.]|nr:hypothetical protein [Sulfuritalea sp.]